MASGIQHWGWSTPLSCTGRCDAPHLGTLLAPHLGTLIAPNLGTLLAPHLGTLLAPNLGMALAPASAPIASYEIDSGPPKESRITAVNRRASTRFWVRQFSDHHTLGLNMKTLAIALMLCTVSPAVLAGETPIEALHRAHSVAECRSIANDIRLDSYESSTGSVFERRQLLAQAQRHCQQMVASQGAGNKTASATTR